jgi:hypothetical protein
MSLEWADHDEHERLRVAAERILQEVGQLEWVLAGYSSYNFKSCRSPAWTYLAVPVRDMGALLRIP